MFGIDSTGTVDVTEKIKEVFALSRNFNLPIIQNTGRYLISGSDRLTWYLDAIDFDMGGATIVPSADYTGNFYFTQSRGMVTYDATSDIVTTLNANASTELVAGNSALDSISGTTTLNDCMVIIKFTDDAYTYNSTGTSGGGQTVKLYHVTRISANGRMDHAFPYTATAIDSIQALPINSRRSTVKLPDVDYTNSPFPIMFQFFYVSNIKYTEGKILNKPITDVGNRHVIDTQYYWHAYPEFVYDPYPSSTFTTIAKTSTTASYTLHHAWGVGFYARNVKAFGYGWGSISAAGYITDTIFENCSANNFDSHGPIIGHYRLINCTVGDTGVVNIGVKNSTVELIRTTFELGKGTGEPYYGRTYFPSLIQTRTTSGGLSDSKLIMRDVIVNGVWKNYSSAVNGRAGIVQGHADPYTSLPVGSPMSSSVFSEIDIQGFTVTDPIMSNILINPVFATRSDLVYHPLALQMRNVRYANGGTIKFNMVNFLTRSGNSSATTDPLKETVDIKIILDDVSVSNLTFQLPTSGYLHNLHVKINNLRNIEYGSTMPILRISQRGYYSINNSELSQIITNDGATEAVHPLDINLFGGIVNSASNAPLVTANTTFLHRFTATGTKFIGDYSASAATTSNLVLSKWCKLVNCQFFGYTDGANVSNLLIWTGSISNTTGTVDMYIAKGNIVSTYQVQSSNTYIDTFVLSYAGSGRLTRSIATGVASNLNSVAGTTSTVVSGTTYAGSATSNLDIYCSYFQVGTRGTQAYITGIYSQLNMTAVYVG